jgi:hypothetical protein
MPSDKPPLVTELTLTCPAFPSHLQVGYGPTLEDAVRYRRTIRTYSGMAGEMDTRTMISITSPEYIRFSQEVIDQYV